MNLKNKYVQTYNNKLLCIAAYEKFKELGYDFDRKSLPSTDCAYIRVDCSCALSSGSRLSSMDGIAIGAKEMSLDEFFTFKKEIETIEIGGKKYSKEDVESRLKDLEEV